MIDEAREEREEELAERDRIGEKAPSEDVAFGGRVGADSDSVRAAERERRILLRELIAERPPLTPAPTPGAFQMPATVPRPRRHTLREELTAALAYLRRRR